VLTEILSPVFFLAHEKGTKVADWVDILLQRAEAGDAKAAVQEIMKGIE
jgi:hypothetical protein